MSLRALLSLQQYMSPWAGHKIAFLLFVPNEGSNLEAFVCRYRNGKGKSGYKNKIGMI